jgi:GT2 family glycosyltransferase
MTTDVRLGIVSWNTAAMLDRALASLPNALGGLKAEVVVVDNASNDSSVEIARRHDRIEVVANDSNLGYARAMNEALSGTQARALIALNPDTEAPPGSLEKLVSTLDEHPRAALVAPTLVDPNGLPQRSVYPYPGVVQALETGFVPRVWRRDASSRGSSVQRLRGRWAVGAVHCIRKAALGGELPYSTRWFMYVEDIELCWRLERSGWCNLLREDVTIVHHGNAAGMQTWGEGADLELKSLPNIYDWLWSCRSPFQARATALVNVLGVGTKSCALQAGAAIAGGRRAQQWRERAKELGHLSVYHSRILRSRTRNGDR